MYTLRYYLNVIDTATDQLIRLLNQHADIDSSAAFILDKVLKKDEPELIEHGYGSIKSSHVVGLEAFNHLIGGIRDLTEEDDNYSRRFVSKYPGFLVVNNIETIAHAVVQLNEAKDYFKRAVMKINGTDERFEQVHDARPYLITTNAYRHIFAIDSEVARLYFNFAHRNSVVHLDYEAVLTGLEHAAKQTPPKVDFTTWQTQVASEITLVDRYRYAKFKRFRTLKVRPEVSVKRTDGLMTGYSAGLPIIVGNAPGKYTALGDYDGSTKRKKRPMVQWRELIPRLNLYVAVDTADIQSNLSDALGNLTETPIDQPI